MSPFGQFMLIFAGAILLYAGLLAITKDYNLLPIRARISVKPKNPKQYTVQIAKAVALTSLSPILAAVTTIWSEFAALFVLLIVMVICLYLSTKIVKVEE